MHSIAMWLKVLLHYLWRLFVKMDGVKIRRVHLEHISESH